MTNSKDDFTFAAPGGLELNLDGGVCREGKGEVGEGVNLERVFGVALKSTEPEPVEGGEGEGAEEAGKKKKKNKKKKAV